MVGIVHIDDHAVISLWHSVCLIFLLDIAESVSETYFGEDTEQLQTIINYGEGRN